VKLLVVPHAHQRAAENAVRSALAEKGAANEAYAFTLIRLPGKQDWHVHASTASGEDDGLARLIQQKLREAGL
jgi:hypothetical protein